MLRASTGITRSGWTVRGSNPDGCEIFRARPHWHWNNRGFWYKLPLSKRALNYPSSDLMIPLNYNRADQCPAPLATCGLSHLNIHSFKYVTAVLEEKTVRKYNSSLLTHHAVNESFLEVFCIRINKCCPRGEPVHTMWTSRALNLTSPELQNCWPDDGDDSF